MQDKLRKQKVHLTLEHPKLEGGVQTYRTEDGWEMVLMLGRQEGEHYQMHRMVMAGPAIVEALISSLTVECPEIVMPIVMKTVMGDLKEHIHKNLKEDKPEPEPNMNDDEPPPGTKFN